MKDGHTKEPSERIILDPPTFSPPPDMRRNYLDARKSEIEAMFDTARMGVWKPVVTIVNHIRGTGKMYGFPAIGDAAESLAKAIQNGDMKCMDYLQAYAKAVDEAVVDTGSAG